MPHRPQVLPPQNIAPAYSCRSGLSVLLSSTTPQGPDAVPFRLDMRKVVTGGGSETFHVVNVKPRTVAEVGPAGGVKGALRSMHGQHGKGEVQLGGSHAASLGGAAVASASGCRNQGFG